jgi:Tol biopolymer transport system component
MKTVTRKAMQIGRTTAVAAAMISAGLLVALVGTPREAEATFPGDNGRIAFASNRTTGEGVNNPEGDFEIFTMNPDGTGLTQLTENAAFDFDPEWSADGQRIAFESDRGLFSEIFVMNADGTLETQVTTNPDFSFDRSPTFSPDGERIAFESNRAVGEGVDNPEKDIEIFVVNLDGTGLQQLTRNAARELHPDYAPNGKKIAFVSERNFQPGIYTMNADGTKQKKRSLGPATAFQFPSWSPDGERIAFNSNQDGPTNIFTMNADGSGQKRLTNNGIRVDRGPVFSPDGKKIAFNSNRDGNFEIYEMNADGTEQLNLTNDPAGDFTPDWQPVKRRY